MLMNSPITLDNFAIFVNGKDPSERYNYADARTCANAQFHHSLNLPYAPYPAAPRVIDALFGANFRSRLTTDEIIRSALVQMGDNGHLLEFLAYLPQHQIGGAWASFGGAWASFGALAEVVKTAQRIRDDINAERVATVVREPAYAD